MHNSLVQWLANFSSYRLEECSFSLMWTRLFLWHFSIRGLFLYPSQGQAAESWAYAMAASLSPAALQLGCRYSIQLCGPRPGLGSWKLHPHCCHFCATSGRWQRKGVVGREEGKEKGQQYGGSFQLNSYSRTPHQLESMPILLPGRG